VRDVFEHYRKGGFPHSPPQNIHAALAAIKRARPKVDDGVLPLSTVGIAALNGYHAHMIDVRCREKRTPREGFEDDEILRRAIRWRIRQGDDLRPYGIVKAIKMDRAVQAASNFRPVVVKALIERFNAKSMIDPCAGFGGRLLGAAACGIRYVGIDPCAKTVAANRRIIDDLGAKNATIIQGCAEDVMPFMGWAPDLIFTSPPYFDVERYSDEPTQSYVRYPTMDTWLGGFFTPMIEASCRLLRSGGVFALNVPDDLVDAAMVCTVGHEMQHIETLMLPFNKRPYQGEAKTEPVLVFQRS